ncbi:hypothetical protein N7468_007840 [Penicillium chermesinum]|uniref:CENP-V/GFA domain-containing protein n=1 Tax=Penicillium chermesinum TaxID=63820 RepID=A0A9W9NQZ5_9EURO|nr:uncharacterized protein N7468_007840 [Penicillium chermesinum]KAJ5223298.1 hypothetical protein N7468_007840 [Penicillium chermesinum]
MAEMGVEPAGTEPPLPSPAATNNFTENTLFTEAWKHRPPYDPKTPEEFGSVKWRAQCQCGKVSYLVKRDQPLNVKICHCESCQRMHGAPFQLAAIFHKEDLAFTPEAGT